MFTGKTEFVLFSLTCIFLVCYSQQPAGNGTGYTSTTDTCLIVPALSTAGQDIVALATAENQLVRISVTIYGANGTYSNKDPRIFRWVISTSSTGQSMLMLKEYFDAMSLYTLGLGVGSYSLTLNQKPYDCLNDKTTEEVETILRHRFLSNFGDRENLFPSGATICNRQIGKRGSNRDRLVYMCCKYNRDNTLDCSELTQDTWLQLLFISIIVLQVLIILYSPIYMPDFMYKAKSIFQTFIYSPDSDQMLELNVKVVSDSSNIEPGFTKVDIQEFTHLNKFKMLLQNVSQDETHTFKVERVDMCVRDSKIVAEGNAPVGFVTFVKDFFLRCKMRYDVPSVGDCCMQDMWVKLPCKVVFRWYQCLSGIMMLISVFVLASPWLLRIWFYYAIEEEIIKQQKQIFENYNLVMPYQGNLVTYLSPTHPLFLVIYIWFAVEILLYMVMPGTVKEKLKSTVRQCFRDTRDKSKLDACGKIASHMLRPLRSYGVVGCILLPFWLIVLPLYCIAIVVEVIPIVNLSVRLIINLIFYVAQVINPNTYRRNGRQESGRCSTWMQNRFNTIIVKNENEANTRLNKLVHTLALIMTFVTIWFFLILVVMCIAFYVECAVYALIGFILNPKYILKYVSLILLIAVYGNECFGGVHSRYAAYSTGINSEVQGMVGDKMTEEASKPGEEQQNSAFRVAAKNYMPEHMCLVSGPDGYLKWKISRLVLFLDKSDIPYIPSSFLFQMGQMNHFQCPGLVHLLYLKAFLDFFLILLFLIFVFIVIFAFGQAEDISTAGQTIAALGTGFFPLILKKFLFQSQGYALDRSNLNWKNMFANLVQKYSEKWYFEDLVIVKKNVSEIMPIASATLDENITVDTVDELGKDRIDEMKTFTNESTDDSGNDALRSSKTVDGINSVHLIVQRGKNAKGKDLMTFYVPAGDTDDIVVDAETML